MVDALEALSLSLLNMASISAFIINTVGSSERLTGHRATNRLSMLAGVTPWTGSSRIDSTTGGVGVETKA